MISYIKTKQQANYPQQISNFTHPDILWDNLWGGVGAS